MQQSHFLFRTFSLFNGYTKYILSFQINASVTVHTTTMIAQMYDLILNSKTKLTKNAIITIHNHNDYKCMVRKQTFLGDKSLFLGWHWQSKSKPR